MPYDPEKSPNDPSRRPETKPGLDKPKSGSDTVRKIGEIATNGAAKDKNKK